MSALRCYGYAAHVAKLSALRHESTSKGVGEVGYMPLDRAEANMVFQLVSRR